jgi:hypothetical protein
MADEPREHDLTPEQQAAVDNAELLAGYAGLAQHHAEELADQSQELADQGADFTTRMQAAQTGKKWAMWVFLVLVAIVLILFGAFVVRGGDSDSTTPTESSGASADTAGGPPGEQVPTPIAGSTWVFFADETESMGLYTIEFAADGSLQALGDPHVYGGTWTEAGESVEIVLQHRELLVAGSFSQEHESEEVFRMVRSGNEMLGEWEVEDMYYSEEGLVVQGTRINQPAAYARPR